MAKREKLSVKITIYVSRPEDASPIAQCEVYGRGLDADEYTVKAWLTKQVEAACDGISDAMKGDEEPGDEAT